MQNFFEDAHVIHSYSRAQAIEDGCLVDVTETAKQVFKLPVALTRAVWEGVVVPPIKAPAGQSEEGRLWDVIWMCFTKAVSEAGKSRIHFQLIVADEPCKQKEITFKAIVSPGDEGEPVLTILMPDED